LVQPAAAHHSPSGQFGQITYGAPARRVDPVTNAPGPRLSPEVPAPGSRASWPVAGESDGVDTPHSASPVVEPAAAGSGLPLSGLGAHLSGLGGTVTAAPGGGAGGAADVPRPVDLPRQREGRVVPPWQSDDLPAEPPTLRLVEPAPLADPALSIGPGPADDLGADLRYDPPTLRLVEPDRQEQAPRRRRMSVDEPVDPPADNGADDSDLLIFSACQSAWFTDGEEEEEQLDWGTAADRGWEAAELAARPAVGAETGAGLPRRVPQQNLVPGSPLPPAEERPLRIVRDAASIAAHTSGYFRGYRRGQEVGGYSVGGRPGRESVGGWDFSREASIGEDEYPSGDYEYRSAR
jgi:hypothetical protein